MVGKGMPPPTERRGRRCGVSSLPPSILALHNLGQGAQSRACYQYALPPTSALARRPATNAVLAQGLGAVQSRSPVAALKPKRERPLSQCLTVAQRRSMDWNGHVTTRPLKVRTAPVVSQSVQAYNSLQRRSSSGSEQMSAMQQQQLARSHSTSAHVLAPAAADVTSPTASLSSSHNGSHADSGVATATSSSSSSTALNSSPDMRVRSPSRSGRSRDDSFSRRRPSGGSSTLSATARHSSTEYALSPDMEQKCNERVVAEICRCYGGQLRTQRAARTIQHAFREHALKKRHAHHRQVRASRVFSTPPTVEQMRLSGLDPAKQHRWLSESKSMHRPLQRSAISPATSMISVASSNGESMDSVGLTEIVVVMPDHDQHSTDVSMAGDVGIGSETSSIASRASPVSNDRGGDGMMLANGHYRGDVVSPISIGSAASPSPGIEAGGQFEVMRRASFAVKPSDSKLKRQRQLRIGITHFNRKPGKGVQYLVAKGLLHDESKAVAVFLKKQGGLSRQMVGEYLGSLQNAFNQTVLLDFVNLFNLQSEPFTAALRKFLSSFRLPGEAQKIERILQVFANRFSECNPEHDLDADIVFVLAFSTIMLNTDMHNKSVKQHMTKEEFIRNNRGINNGEDIPREFLESIFDDVSAQEFKTSKDHVQQVQSLEKTIVGPCPRLSQPHRQLVHVARMTEVVDKDKKQPPNQHSRFLFLFNDMILVAKYAPKKQGWTYIFKSSLPLLGMRVQEFSNQHYKRGVQIMTNYEGKVMLTFNGEKEETKRNFVRDLREVMAEIVEMEAERMQDMERANPRSKSSDFSPETSRRGAQANAAQAASSISQSVPSSLKGSALGPTQTLVPILETDAVKRASLDYSSLRPPATSAGGHEKRSHSAADIKMDELQKSTSPTPSVTSQGNGDTSGDNKDNGTLGSSWRSKLYSGKKRKVGAHLP